MEKLFCLCCCLLAVLAGCRAEGDDCGKFTVSYFSLTGSGEASGAYDQYCYQDDDECKLASLGVESHFMNISFG